MPRPTFRNKARLFLVLLAGLFIAAWALSAAGKTSSITWLTPSKGEALAKKNGKPIFYDFTAEWCGYCRILDRAVFQNPKHAKRIASSFVTIRVLDRQREEGRNKPDVDRVMREFSIRAFPTLAVKQPDGTTDTLMGFAGEQGTIKFLEKNGLK
jgi:thiol:disulfide interchange protein